jgi:hypothetical protein
VNLARLRKNSLRFPRIRRAIALGVINRMDTHNRAFLFMFMLLTYLLFRRPASAVSKRLPIELNFQIGHTVKTRRAPLGPRRPLQRRHSGFEGDDIYGRLQARRWASDGWRAATLGLVWWFGKEGSW